MNCKIYHWHCLDSELALVTNVFANLSYIDNSTITFTRIDKYWWRISGKYKKYGA